MKKQKSFMQIKRLIYVLRFSVQVFVFANLAFAVFANLDFATFTNVAFANVAQLNGFGARSASLGGVSTALGGWDGFSAYHNPAAVTRFNGNDRFALGIHTLNVTPKFNAINNVVIENEYTSDRVTIGNVDNNYRNTLGDVLGFRALLFPQFLKSSFGFTAYLPLEQIAYIDSGEMFVPEYVLYRARTQRPQFDFSIGIQPHELLSFGVGAHLGYSLTSNGTVFLQTDSSRPSTMRFAASMKPRLSPYFGVLFQDERWSFGLVSRMALESGNFLVLRSGARAFGSFAALDFNFLSSSVLYYDPLTVEIGTSVTYLKTDALELTFFGQVDFEAWQEFKSPGLLIENPTTESCSGTSCGGIAISPGKAPSYSYQNILVKKVAHEAKWGQWGVRVGFAHRPSIFSTLSTDAGNYVDTERLTYTAGFGYQFKDFLGFNTKWSLDTQLSYHELVNTTVVKTLGDERGIGTGDTKIGAPGYSVGGKLYGAGLSASFGF